MEIRENYIRTAITNMFHTIKNLEEIEHDKRNKINFKMSQIKLMEMKNTSVKNILDMIKSRLDIAGKNQ